MLAYVRTPSGATCKSVLQVESTFIDMKISPEVEPGDPVEIHVFHIIESCSQLEDAFASGSRKKVLT